MKIRPEIQERIITAANALVAEGVESPTNDDVRSRMGGGSLSHISPVMRTWRESRKSEVVTALEMPADLRRVIESSMGQVWTTASKLAAAAVESVRITAADTVAVATGERDEAFSEIARLEEQCGEFQNLLAEKEQVISHGCDEVEKFRTQSVQLASENASLMARLEDREAHIQALKADLKYFRDDHRKLQAELVEIARRN